MLIGFIGFTSTSVSWEEEPIRLVVGMSVGAFSCLMFYLGEPRPLWVAPLSGRWF